MHTFMDLALDEAHAAAETGEVPIGCVVVHDGDMIAQAGNRTLADRDPTAHAEILALRRASEELGTWHLEGCAMVVTLEPCAMCAGAIVLARIDRLVFGASDPKAGFAGSLGDLVRDGRLNHEVDVTVGVLADECGEVLRAFFAERR